MTYGNRVVRLGRVRLRIDDERYVSDEVTSLVAELPPRDPGPVVKDGLEPLAFLMPASGLIAS